jgi:hypothetical protein
MSPATAESRWSWVREAAGLAAVHAALFAAIWLASIAVYALAFTEAGQPLWLAIDAALVASCLALVRARWHRVGFSALGGRKAVRIAAAAALALVLVALTQYGIEDKNGVWLDEGEYLRTLREGRIVREGLFPFNLRWLEPFLAGAWNILPLDDAAAIKAINFGALVVAAVLLVLLLARLGVGYGLALTAPVFFLASYLGVYAAKNRLVLDPFNYAMFAVLFHAALRREHRWLFGAALLAATLNSEKAVYWVPIFGLVELARAEARGLGRWTAAAAHAARTCGPALAYLVAIRLYLLPSETVSETFLDNLHLMAPTWLKGSITSEVAKGNSFQILWFPFGAFTVYALLGFQLAPRAQKPIALLLLPIMASVLVANDTQRMLAYAFIVYLPFGYLYLARALAELPRRAAIPVLAVSVALAAAQHYLLPALEPLRARYQLGPLGSPKLLKLVLAAVELLLVTGLVFVHQTFYRPDDRPDHRPDPDRPAPDRPAQTLD